MSILTPNEPVEVSTMKKNILGAVIFFSLLALAALSIYIFVARTSSGHRLEEFQRTASFLEERISSLERQRDLLGETATALDGQAVALQEQSRELARRIVQIDTEISSMRDLIGGARNSVGTPLFSLRGFRISAPGGIIVIACLAFIWLLYTTLRTGVEKEAGDHLAVPGEPEEEEVEPVPGSVLEEEFPSPSGRKSEPDDGRQEPSADGPSPAANFEKEEIESPSSPADAEQSESSSERETPPAEKIPVDEE